MLQAVEKRRSGRRKANKRRGNMVEGIKEIALKQFNSWGYRGTTVRDICSEIEITAPSLYYYFDSKETIFSTLLDDAAELMVENMRNAMSESKETSAPDRMRALFGAVLAFNRQHGEHSLFIVKNRCFEEKGLNDIIDAKMKHHGKELIKEVTNFIKESQKRKMPKTAVKDVVIAFDGFVTGYLLQLHQGLIKDTDEQALKSWELFWEGIK